LGGAGGGVKISRLCPGSGFGLGFGAFFASLLPLSLFPMRASMPQMLQSEKPRLPRLQSPAATGFKAHYPPQLPSKKSGSRA